MFEVTKALMIDAILGCQPSYAMMNNPFCEAHGVYRGSYGIWEWNRWSFDEAEYTLEMLVHFYTELKAN